MTPTRTSPTLIATSLIALVLAGAVSAQGLPPATEFSDDPSAVVISFGDTEVTLEQFDAAFDRAARSTAIGQGMPVTDEVLAEFEAFKGPFLEQYATQLVLADEAEHRGLEPSDADVDAVIDSLRAEQADTASFDAWLSAAGYSDEQELRATVTLSLAVQALVDTVASEVALEPGASRAWYDANPTAVTDEGGELVPFEAVEPQIEQLLVQEAVEAEIDALVARVDLELTPAGR